MSTPSTSTSATGASATSSKHASAPASWKKTPTSARSRATSSSTRSAHASSSSYRATAGQALRPPFLTIAPLLRGFADDYVRAQRRFAAFVLAGIGVEAPDSIANVYTGSAGFADRHAPKRPVREVPRRQWDPVPPSLETVFAEHDGDAIAHAYRSYGYTLTQIAEHLGVHYSTVSRRLRRLEHS